MGNPINPATGNKFESASDFVAAGAFPLRWIRYYNSQLATGQTTTGYSSGWRSAYDRRVHQHAARPNVIEVAREDGKMLRFDYHSGTGEWRPDPDLETTTTLVQIAGGWQFSGADDVLETYDADGRLLSLESREGHAHHLLYDAQGRLERVEHGTYRVPDGQGGFAPQSIEIAYDDSGRIYQLTDPAGRSWHYEYEARGNLWKVTAPGEAGQPPAVREYVYERWKEGLNWRSILTGIVDENGDRYATWEYEITSGYAPIIRATSSWHGGTLQADRVTLTYSSPIVTAFTDSYGVTRNQSLEIVHGVARAKNVSSTTRCALCEGREKNATWNALGFPAGRTDFNGNQTTFQFDGRGLETQRIEGAGTAERRIADRTWVPQWRLPDVETVSDAAGTRRAIDRDYVSGRPTLVTETDLTASPSPERLTVYTWTTDGLLESVDGPGHGSADLVRYSYDPNTRFLTGIDRPGDLDTQLPATDYDANGRPTRVIDPNGSGSDAVLLTWHPRGWLRTMTLGGQTTTWDYDGVGQLTRVTLPGGDYLDYEYDAAHRLTEVRDAEGNRLALTPGVYGKTVVEAYFEPGAGTPRRTIDYVYDTLDRLQEILAFGGTTTTFQFTYDNHGNIKRVIDPRDPISNSLYTEYTYDALNRVKQIRDAAAGITNVGRDVGDGPTAVTTPPVGGGTSGAQTVHTYDGFGGLRSVTSPDTGTGTRTYDASGNVSQSTDGRGIATTWSYDALDRPTATLYPTTPGVAWTWDSCPYGKGRLCGYSDDSDTTVYGYDRRGNRTQKTVTVNGAGTFTAGGSFSTAYQYDGADRLTRITYPSGRQVRYTRDAAGRVSGVYTTAPGTAEQSVLSSAAYAAFGPLEGYTAGNGVASVFTLDSDYRVTSVNHGGIDVGYPRDAADNVIRESSIYQDLDRSYEAQSRLASAVTYETASFTEGFNYYYDGNGNRTAKEQWTDDPWFLSAYSYPAAPAGNRLLAIGPGSSPWTGQVDPQQTRSHDAAGNVTGIDYADYYLADIAIAYGDHGRPTQVTTGEYLTVAMGHNALGQRVRMDVTGGMLAASFPDKTLHYDEAGHIIAEYHSTGEAYEYIYLDDLPVGFVHYADAQSPGTLYHYHTDHLGTPRWATNATGTVVWEAYSSDPFRVNGGGTAGLAPGLRFPGQYYQPETGFHYNYYRDYDPATGRYLQPDPIGLAGGLNPYAYAEGNPLRFTDPTGEFADTVTDLGFVAYDVYRLVKDNVVDGCDNLSENLSALGADALGTLVPFGTGFGLGVRAARATTRVKPPLQTPERVIVDSRGNAIPLNKGESITRSPDGKWVQVRDANGNPTGMRIDGPHSPRTHSDPRALQPHGHVPGVTNPDGTPWLPIK